MRKNRAEGAPDSNGSAGLQPQDKSGHKGPLGLGCFTASKAADTDIYITDVILSGAKDLRFESSRAETRGPRRAVSARWGGKAHPVPVEAWGFSPTKTPTNEEAFRPGLLHNGQGIKHGCLHNKCHPEQSEGPAVCVKTAPKAHQIPMEVQGFSPRTNQATRGL